MPPTAAHIKETTEQIAARPYTRELVRNAGGTWFARVVEFQGCMTEGESADEALTNLEDAMIGWIEVHLEDDDPIPPPLTIDHFSGKFVLRVAKAHRDLARRAEIEGVSLNQYLSTQLARMIRVPETREGVTYMSKKNAAHYYVERRSDGSYAGTRGGAERAGFTGATQAAVIDAIKRSAPDAPIHVERVRDTDGGGRDKWRSP